MKKEGWGGGGSRVIKSVNGTGDIMVLKASGKMVSCAIGPGLPKNSRK